MSTLNQSRNGPAFVQLREAHPGPAHARAGGSEPARESPHRIGPRRPLVVVAVAVVMSLVVFAVWRLFLAPSAVPPDVIAVSGRIEGDDSAVDPSAHRNHVWRNCGRSKEETPNGKHDEAHDYRHRDDHERPPGPDPVRRLARWL